MRSVGPEGLQLFPAGELEVVEQASPPADGDAYVLVRRGVFSVGHRPGDETSRK